MIRTRTRRTTPALGCAALMAGLLAACTSAQSGLDGPTQATIATYSEAPRATRALASPDSGYGSFLTAYSGSTPPKGSVGLCGRYAWACSTQQSSVSDAEALQTADRINRQVNMRIRAASDPQLYGVAERWTLPVRGAGDCEDYALLKKKLLLEAGLPGKMLLLATGMNRKAEPHAVLVLRLASGDYILDNLTSSVKRWQQTGYTFVKMQKPGDPSQWDAVLLGPFASRS